MTCDLRNLAALVLVLLAWGCDPEKPADTKMFSELSAERSGVLFSNDLTENDSLNYFTYAYIYMGGGVSVGDINNDGLADLYFTGNMVPNKLYLNQGNLRFKDITEEAGVAGDQRWYTGVTMADVNHDGLMDIYCSVGGKFGPRENQLFLNQGDLTFREAAGELGLADAAHSVQATFFDFDRDGDLDLYQANYPPAPFDAPNQFYRFKQQYPKPDETDRLYRNDNGKFTDISREAGLASYGLSLSATVSDLDLDGWPDLYVSNDFSTPDYLFLNNGDGTFTDQLKESTRNTAFYGMGVDIADINNDSYPDIMQVDMTAENNRRSKANMASMNPALFWSTVNSGFHYQYMQNSLQLHNGLLKDSLPDFSNISRLAGVSSTDWSWGPLLADLDNDGYKDLFITNGTRREINNRDFFRALEGKGIPKDSMLALSLAIPSEPIDNYIYRNNGELGFEKKNREWGVEFPGFSNGGVYADLDNDGDLDLVINNIDDRARIWENQGGNASNYLQFEFHGPPTNPQGIGVKVELRSANGQQMQELYLSRGFQSSVAPRLHFGMGADVAAREVRITWPDGREEILADLPVNQLLRLDYRNASEHPGKDVLQPPVTTRFETVQQESLEQYRHQENGYDDYKKEILLPYELSRLGPFMAVGDLDGDGLEDVVVGGARGQAASLFLQKDGALRLHPSPALQEDAAHEDAGIQMFDANGDGHQDLYIASGGNEMEAGHSYYQDRLYLGDGKGGLSKAETALPETTGSAGRVIAIDHDKDGDMDLFVTGRQSPGTYPMPGQSYLLENQSEQGRAKFVNRSELLPEQGRMGMVTDATVLDFDQDGLEDLVLSGEWMPLTFLHQTANGFQDVTKNLGLEGTTGWWYSLSQGDLDGDGDLDLVAGNLGLNYKYQATKEETFDIYFNDFDQNEQGDIVLSYFNDGEKFPLRGRECSSQQIPGIKKKFKDYASFAQANLEEVYTEQSLEASLHYQAKSFASVVLWNEGGSFTVAPLPRQAQFSSVQKSLVHDLDGDGQADLLLAGNLYRAEVETPRNDASIGAFFKGGSGMPSYEHNRENGLYLPGDIKDLVLIRLNGQLHLLSAENDGPLKLVRVLRGGEKLTASASGPRKPQ